MSGVYDAASSLAVLLGLILALVALAKYFDPVIDAMSDLGGWIVENVVGIVAFFFLLSLLLTAIAATGFLR
jgi:hypothetical protein